MNLRPNRGFVVVLLACALLVGAARAASRERWRTFVSPAGFSVRYPGQWRLLRGDARALDALSPGRRDEGVIIGPRQAELRVEQLPQTDSAETALRSWAKGVRIPRSPAPTKLPANCRDVMTENNEGEGPPDQT